MRQEAEEKAHQTSQKMDFEHQVYNQQIKELRERLETASATILSLETRIRQYSKSDTSVSGLLQQVRESAEEEMMRFKIESEENYARNVRISLNCLFITYIQIHDKNYRICLENPLRLSMGAMFRFIGKRWGLYYIFTVR